MAALKFEVEVVFLRRRGLEWTPFPVSLCDDFVGRHSRLRRRDRIDAKVDTRKRKIGKSAVLKTSNKTGEHWRGYRRDLRGPGCSAGDELVHLCECRWIEGQFAVVE